MTATTRAGRRGPGAGASGHYPYTIPKRVEARFNDYFVYHAACSCGWINAQTNTKRENAVRAARQHVQEAQS